MKKNISINLFGSLYCIDEDAYELLEKYLDNMKSYFSRRDGGDEIADDIEHRVAELFEELKASGREAVAIEDVQAIIRRIGNPEEMDDAGGTGAEGSDDDEHGGHTEDKAGRRFGGRKLFRNPDNQVLGGVLSGLCTYFGGNDPLPWRIIFVVLAIATQIIPFFIVYLILWGIMPMAVTAEDKLRMKGRPVNVNTLNEEIMTDAVNTDKGKIKSIFNTIIAIIGFCLKLFFAFIIGMTLLATIIIAGALATGLMTPLMLTGFDETRQFVEDFLEATPMFTTLTWVSVIAAIVFLSTILYSIIHSIIKKNTKERMSNTTRIAIVIISIISLMASIGTGVAAFNIAANAELEYDRSENTVDGVYLSDNQHERLAQAGWEIVSYENASDRLYHRVRSFLDDDHVDLIFKFQRRNVKKPMKADICRTEDFPAGNYHLEAIVSAECNGAYVYARNDSTVYASVMMPVDDSNNMGNMRNMTEDELRNTVFFDYPASDEIWEEDDFYETIAYWSYVRSESFHHDGGPITKGVTNMGSAIGIGDSRNPAWNFSLRQIKVVAE